MVTHCIPSNPIHFFGFLSRSPETLFAWPDLQETASCRSSKIPILAANLHIVMHDINALQRRIQEEITQLRLPESPANLYDPIRYMLEIGGKRVRPLLVLLAADLFGIPKIDDALPAALAVEFFHNFSLVHDDIMDNAPLRRGQQTIHKKWSGDVAILSGDNLLILAYTQLACCQSDKLPALLDAFNTMATEVCEGQQLDMDFENTTAVGINDYLRMIRLKTSVLLGTALQMGAILADADETDARLIYEFGVNLGLAFQLQDDILDVYGDPGEFGKQQGGDILADKKTYLLLKALETADMATRSAMEALFGNTGDPEAKIRQITAIYDRLGVRDKAEQAKRHFVDQAVTALNRIGRPEDRKVPLRMLACRLLDRTR